jgi:hypothetical protein
MLKADAFADDSGEVQHAEFLVSQAGLQDSWMRHMVDIGCCVHLIALVVYQFC